MLEERVKVLNNKQINSLLHSTLRENSKAIFQPVIFTAQLSRFLSTEFCGGPLSLEVEKHRKGTSYRWRALLGTRSSSQNSLCSAPSVRTFLFSSWASVSSSLLAPHFDMPFLIPEQNSHCLLLTVYFLVNSPGASWSGARLCSPSNSRACLAEFSRHNSGSAVNIW